MSEPNVGQTGAESAPKPARRDNLIERLLYNLGFAVVAYLTLHLLFALAIGQFVLRALDAAPNGELTQFLARLTRYLAQICGYVALISDDRPFPFGPFPADGDGK